MKHLIALLIILTAAPLAAQPLSTEFTVSGVLNQGGAPASGNFDFEFEAFDALSGGTSFAPANSFSSVPLANGAFRFDVDFGTNTFLGETVFLEIRVREAGGSTFSALAPRQKLNATPYSIYSLTSDLAVSAMSVDYSDITNRPSGLDDGDDDTVGMLSCAAGEIAKYDGAMWACGADVDTDTDTDTLAELSCGNDQIARYDGSIWTCSDDVDTTDPNTDTLADLSCSGDQIARYDGAQWVCSDDVDTTDPNTDTLADLSCATNQIARYDGSRWICSDDMEGGGSAANVISVATSGGDFTSIADAVASIGDASATNPYLVRVAPGVFTETSLVDITSYVHVQGSGVGVTIVTSSRSNTTPTANSATVQMRDRALLSDITVDNEGDGVFAIGLFMDGSVDPVSRATLVEHADVRATGVKATNNGGRYGAYLREAEPTIRATAMRATGVLGFATAVNAGLGLINDNGGFNQALIIDSTIIGAGNAAEIEDSLLGGCTDPTGTGFGIQAQEASPDIRGSYVCGGHRGIAVTQNGNVKLFDSTAAASSTGSAFLFETTASGRVTVVNSQVLYVGNKHTGTGALTCIDSILANFTSATDGTTAGTACN